MRASTGNLAAAPSTGRRRFAALAAVALAACAVGVAARESGALAPLEREALKARFNVRGAEPVKGLLVVGIDAKTFTEFNTNWPFPPLLPRAGWSAAPRRRRAHDRLRRPVHRADQGARGPRAVRRARRRRRRRARHERERRPRPHARARRRRQPAPASTRARRRRDLRNDRAARSPASRARSAGSTARGGDRRARHRPHAPTAPASATAGAWIDYRGPPGHDPDGLLLGRLHGRVDRSRCSRPDRRRRRDRADAPGRSRHPGRRRAADVRRRDPGQRDLDRAARPPAALRAAWIDLLVLVLLALLAPLRPLAPAARRRRRARRSLAGAAFLVAAQLAFERRLDRRRRRAARWRSHRRVRRDRLRATSPSAAFATASAATTSCSSSACASARRSCATPQLEIVHRLAQAAEWRDDETGEHIERMGRLCERLAREVGLSAVEAELLRHASALHDVGKIGIPDEILLKPGKLDPAEWEIMQTHTRSARASSSGSQSRARPDRRADRAHATTSAGTAAATRSGSRARRSRWPGASARSATCSTRCSAAPVQGAVAAAAGDARAREHCAARTSTPRWSTPSCHSPRTCTPSASARSCPPRPTPPPSSPAGSGCERRQSGSPRTRSPSR